MRIVSLLPSATEIVFALGLGGDLRGVSFECDFPERARAVTIVSGTALPTGGSLSAREIDAAVSSRIAAGESIYTLDDARIRAIDPDLILAQDLCRVCAVPSGAVEEALDVIGCHARVVSLDPSRLDDVIGCIGLVGAATGTVARADALDGEPARARRRGTAPGPGPRPPPGAGPRMVRPALQCRALGARPGGGGWRRDGPRRSRCPFAPAHLGRDRRGARRRHHLHAMRIRFGGGCRAGARTPGSSRSGGPRSSRRGRRQRILLQTGTTGGGRRGTPRGVAAPASGSDAKVPGAQVIGP